MKGEQFVREVVRAPEPCCVLANKRQINEYCVLVSIQHLILVSFINRNGVHPLFFRSSLIHHRKLYSSYKHLPQVLGNIVEETAINIEKDRNRANERCPCRFHGCNQSFNYNGLEEKTQINLTRFKGMLLKPDSNKKEEKNTDDIYTIDFMHNDVTSKTISSTIRAAALCKHQNLDFRFCDAISPGKGQFVALPCLSLT